MSERDIESILAQHGGLRRSFKDLEMSVKTCDKKAITHMLDSKTELEILTKTKTINFNEWNIVSNRIREIGDKFSDGCVCSGI